MNHDTISDPRGTHERPNTGYTLPLSSHFFRQIKDNWVVLAFIVALIVQWANFNTRMVQAESDIQDLTNVVEQINEININIAVMQTDIQYIKKNLP